MATNKFIGCLAAIIPSTFSLVAKGLIRTSLDVRSNLHTEISSGTFL